MPIVTIFSGIGIAPEVVTATVLSSTSIRIAFSEAMTSNAALGLAASYTITPDIGSDNVTITSVSVSTNAVYVTLTFSTDLTTGTNNYEVEVNGVLDAAGNPIDVGNNTATFSGPEALIPSVAAIECYEDIALPATELEEHVSETWDEDLLIPLIVAYRGSLLALGTSSAIARVRAHALIDLAYSTEVGNVLNEMYPEIKDRDKTRVCSQRSVFSVYRGVTPFLPLLPRTVDELRQLGVSQTAIKLLLPYVNSTSLVHVVSAAATIVLIAAIKTL